MTEKKKNRNKLDFKDISLGGSVEITLDGHKPAKTGESQYGEWNLWFGHVENTKTWAGEKGKQEPVDNYTGGVLFFPTEKVSEQLTEIANGNDNVKVKITKKAGEMDGRVYKFYEVEKLAEGKPSASASSLQPGELKILADFEQLRKEGLNLSEEDFLKAAKEEDYGPIPEERAKTLYSYLK